MSLVRTCLLAFAVLAIPAPSANAQTILQNIFGIEKPAARPSPIVAGHRLPRSANPAFVIDLFEGEAPPPEPTYRTICVRMCDGYYFPISFTTTRSGFAADAQKCAESCSGGQLFFHANPGEDVADARDFSGLQYGLLPNAFRYRKTLVEGCQCKPQPWSDEERQRHLTYIKLARKAPPPAIAPAPAPSAASLEPSERPLAVIRRGTTEPTTPILPSSDPPRNQPNLLERAAPPAAGTPGAQPRPLPRRQQSDVDIFAPVTKILFGLPPKPPRK